MLATPDVLVSSSSRKPKPFCRCRTEKTTVPWRELEHCHCAEVPGCECEWVWDTPSNSSVILSDDKKQVTFHPSYSSGTGVVKGNMPLSHNVHYYWEVKMLTETYGTDIIIGLGTSRMDITSNQYNFVSLLGSNEESYGLSYTGKLRHMNWEIKDAGGFCRGSVVGVRVDMWHGTLQFYVNREPQGVSFYNLRRHELLFPMISSTAAQSSLQLVHASSHHGTLLVHALKILLSSANPRRNDLPPGLQFQSSGKFWLSLPTDGLYANPFNLLDNNLAVKSVRSPLVDAFLSEYVDSVQREYRVVLWQQERHLDTF